MDGKLFALNQQNNLITPLVNTFSSSENYSGTLTSFDITESRSNGEKLLACGTQNGNLILIENNTQPSEYIFRPHVSGISQMKFSSNAQWLATASYDGVVTVWNLAQLKNKGSFYQPLIINDLETWALSIAFSEDSNVIFVGTRNGDIRYWMLDPAYYAKALCENIQELKEDELLEWRRIFDYEFDKNQICK